MAIRGNAIYGNTKLGIDLAPTLPGGTVTPNDTLDDDGGPNRLQNFPVLNPITEPCGVITGTIPGESSSVNPFGFRPASPVTIDFYANATCDAAGNGEGEVHLGSVVVPLTSTTTTFSFSFTPVAGKPVITATATDANGNTSEFSSCQAAPVNQAPVVAPASVACAEGAPGANSLIANITDANQASNTLGITINGQPISPSPTVSVNGVTISNLAITPAGALTADVAAACGATSATFTLAATDNCGAATLPTALTVTVNPAPAAMANAGMDQVMCSTGATTTFTLAGSAANGAAAWSVVSGPVSITNPGALNSTAVFTGAGTATLRLTVTNERATLAIVVGDTVRLRANSQVYDVHFNEEFFGPDATILGNQVTPQSLPVFASLPALPAITPGATDIEVPANQTMSLAAGAYRKITVNHDASLILTGGVYHLEKLDIRQDAKLHFTAPVEVRVKNEMDTDANAFIGRRAQIGERVELTLKSAF